VRSACIEVSSSRARARHERVAQGAAPPRRLGSRPIPEALALHRKPLLDLLARYRTRHPEEAACADRVRTLVESRPDCFERGCRPGHVTGSALVLSADHRRCLLVHHRKLGRWLQPGGHADGEPDVAAVALREAHEETGLERLEFWRDAGEIVPLDLDVHRIPARAEETEHEHHDVRFLLIAAPGEAALASPESLAVRWFGLDELAALGGDESLLRLGRKARRLLATAAQA
jgi:8-oxo-dGTP pyrophosphatase MutT (NUDIX family)